MQMGMVLAMKQSVDHPNNRLDMNMNLFVVNSMVMCGWYSI